MKTFAELTWLLFRDLRDTLDLYGSMDCATRLALRVTLGQHIALQGVEKEDGHRIHEELGSRSVVVPLDHDEVLATSTSVL